MRTYNNSIVIKFDTTATGNAGAGKPVTVYEVGTVTKAELFNSAEQAITNPINADNEGNYSFKVANGIYDIVIDQGLPTQVKIENELITDAAGGGSGSSAIETIELTSGQVLVQFTVNTEGASFYINGTGADNGRILESVNYSYNQSLNQVTLTNSYPSGTYISAIRDTGYINEDYVRYFDELSDAVTSTKLADGDKIYLEDRTAGNGGGAMWNVVLASTVTPNTFNIVACTGVPTLALVLHIDSKVHSKQFGLVGDGAANDTIAIQALRDYASVNPEKEIIFDEGTYIYSASPNWAIPKLVVSALGTVTFRNTGTGNCLIFDDPTGTTFDITWCWDNPIFIEGDNNTGHGVYNRSVHHSKIAANIRGCGLNCHKVEFAVVNEYNITSSINEGSFYSATAPAGISITERNPGEQASANIWYNPIIEGMRSVGIFVDKALNNKFIGGTSEGNAGNNIECSVDSRNNSFEGIDLEVSGASQSFVDRGRWNKWLGVFCDQNSTIASTAIGTEVRGGIHNAIINSGDHTFIDRVSYGANGDELTDTGTFTTITDAYDIESASIKVPNKSQGITRFTSTETVGAFAVTPLVPGNVTKVGIPLTGVKVGDLVTLSSATQEPNTFAAPTARCGVDGQIDITFSQLNGTAVSPLPSGGDFVISVNGG